MPLEAPVTSARGRVSLVIVGAPRKMEPPGHSGTRELGCRTAAALAQSPSLQPATDGIIVSGILTRPYNAAPKPQGGEGLFGSTAGWSKNHGNRYARTTALAPPLTFAIRIASPIGLS